MNVYKSLVVCSLLVIFATPVAAEVQDAESSGWFGNFLIGGAFVSARPSGLDVYDDNDRLDSLISKGRRQSEGFALLGAEVGYRISRTGTSLSAGGWTENPWHLTLAQELRGFGRLALSALYAQQEVWRNPYLTGVERSRTDSESIGYAFSWDNVLLTNFSVSFEQLQIDIKQDLIGVDQPDLRRDGTDSTLKFCYRWNLAEAGNLSANISHVWIDRDGASNSGDGDAVNLTHLLEMGRFSFTTELDLSQSRYDEVHPFFNKKREETTFSAMETVMFGEPFGLKRSYLFGAVAYSETDSDDEFFSNSQFVVGSGIGYRF